MSRRNLNVLKLHDSIDEPCVSNKLRHAHERQRLVDSAYESWFAFRRHHTACALSKEQDKLVAIKGIADRMGQAVGDRLVAGLW